MLGIAIASALAGFFFGPRLRILSLVVLSALAALTAAVLTDGGLLAAVGAGAVGCATFQLAAFGAMMLHDGNGPARGTAPVASARLGT